MALIAPTTPIAYAQKRVDLYVLGRPIPDGDGGYYQPEEPLDPPQVWAHVTPASTRDLESTAAGTVIAQATHIVRIRFHAGVTINTIVRVEDPPRPSRRLNVIFVGNPNERNADLELLCTEVLADDQATGYQMGSGHAE